MSRHEENRSSQNPTLQFARTHRSVLSVVFAVTLAAACDDAAVVGPVEEEENIAAIITPPADEPGDGSAPVLRNGDVIPSELYGATVFWIEPVLTVSGKTFTAKSSYRAWGNRISHTVKLSVNNAVLRYTGGDTWQFPFFSFYWPKTVQPAPKTVSWTVPGSCGYVGNQTSTVFAKVVAFVESNQFKLTSLSEDAGNGTASASQPSCPQEVPTCPEGGTVVTPDSPDVGTCQKKVPPPTGSGGGDLPPYSYCIVEYTYRRSTGEILSVRIVGCY
jgi:hypothetical protein